MKFIQNLSFKLKLLLIAIPPLLGVTLLSIWLILGLIDKKINLETSKNKIKEAETLAKIIHFMQIERGLSVGFVSSNGIKNKDKILEIRQKVNTLSEEAKNIYSETKGDNSVLNKLNELSTKRSLIDKLEISAPQVGAYYSKTITSILDTTITIPSLIDDKDSRNSVQAYTHLATTKEQLGQIRANLNGTFTRNSFIEDSYSTFLISLGALDANKYKFLVLAPEELINFYKNNFKGTSVEKTFSMIAIAKTKGTEGNFNIESADWFTNVSSSIDILREIEIELYKYIYNKLDERIDHTNNEIYIIISAIILSIFLVVVILFLTMKNILASIYCLQNGLYSFFSYLNRKTSNVQLIEMDSKDELGEMATIINQNIQQIELMINQDNLLIDDAKIVMTRVNNGWYSQFIEKSTSNASLEEFKNSVNQMIQSTRQRFLEIDEILEEYSKHNYIPILKMKETDEKGGLFERLIYGVNSLQNSITQMLIENKTNGLTLDESSNILLKNVDSLNVSSNSAAASLEETAAALEEITSNIRNTTENIAKMSNLSNNVTKSATSGEKLANQTTVAMDEINDQVNLITDAISIIDQIAFQTNILSLNAAVEAATAGEAGKGFAVVAAEVRNLANRSAEAAKEIKTIVENAKNKANEGKNIASHMISGYKELNENIQQTVNLISDIEMSSKEQLTGIEQINDAVNQLDEQTQQNAQIASQTHDVAVITDSIAKLVVSNANAKEFEGKNEVKSKSLNIKSNHLNNQVTPKNTSTKTTHTKIAPKTITPSNNDEWESF